MALILRNVLGGNSEKCEKVWKSAKKCEKVPKRFCPFSCHPVVFLREKTTSCDGCVLLILGYFWPGAFCFLVFLVLKTWAKGVEPQKVPRSTF